MADLAEEGRPSTIAVEPDKENSAAGRDSPRSNREKFIIARLVTGEGGLLHQRVQGAQVNGVPRFAFVVLFGRFEVHGNVAKTRIIQQVAERF